MSRSGCGSGRLDRGRCGASLARRPNAARCHRRGQDAGHHSSAHPALGGRQQSGGVLVAHTACLRCWPSSRPSWRQQSLGPVAPCLPCNTARHRSCTASCPCLATFSVCSSPPAHHEHASSTFQPPSQHHHHPTTAPHPPPLRPPLHQVRLNLLPALLEEAWAHLHSCLCASALGRRIFVQPFHRDVVVTPGLVAAMASSLHLCRQVGP